MVELEAGCPKVLCSIQCTVQCTYSHSCNSVWIKFGVLFAVSYLINVRHVWMVTQKQRYWIVKYSESTHKHKQVRLYVVFCEGALWIQKGHFAVWKTQAFK